MLQAGTRGETAKAIRSSFHFPVDLQLNSGYQSLRKELQGDLNTTFEMVNRIYPAEGFELNKEFRSTLKNYFGAEPYQLNFGKNVEAASEINSFVNQSTHGKIHDLIDASDLNAGTKLVLINAIYFKGVWETQFRKNETRKMDFYTSETASTKVDMMKLETEMLYGKIPELDATAVSLPYEGGRWSMMILLPNKRTGLSEMEDKLKSVPMDKITKSLKIHEVLLHLPKFKLESSIDLKVPFTQLGAEVLFNGADLSGIPATSVSNLVVSKAVQKAFIEVNEEGSEAAAATGMITAVTSGPPEFHVDHPFFSVLVHRKETVNNHVLSVDVNPVFMQRVARI